MHDIVIIGGGPAGMTAALYALRAGKSVLMLEKKRLWRADRLFPESGKFPRHRQHVRQ